MAYAIARIAKLKGGSVAASDRHVERQRNTPNADRDKQHENIRLIGDARPLREIVTEMIERHGGKPRCDSVECVELMLGASPEHFTEGHDEPSQRRVQKRVREFADKVTEFLREQYGERVVKAVLHVDEKTPHVQAFMVPIDERGKLNCKSFFGTRQRLREFQNAFAEKMQPLGLERGIEGSRATHTDISRFYGAINREVRLRVAPERVPDPPRMMVTEASRKSYKQEVIRAVADQIHEPVNTLGKQAQLAREEKGKREAAEKRAKEAARREKEWAEKYLAEQKENIAFHHRTRELEAALAGEQKEKAELSRELGRMSRQVETVSARVRDIPLAEVMPKLGYRGEREGASIIYRDRQGRAALAITDGKVIRGKEVVARNAIDLVIHMREVNERVPTTEREAVAWLSESLGKDRAIAASVVRAEQRATEIIREHERTREVERVPQRETQQEFTRERVQHQGRGGCSR